MSRRSDREGVVWPRFPIRGPAPLQGRIVGSLEELFDVLVQRRSICWVSDFFGESVVSEDEVLNAMVMKHLREKVVLP